MALWDQLCQSDQAPGVPRQIIVDRDRLRLTGSIIVGSGSRSVALRNACTTGDVCSGDVCADGNCSGDVCADGSPCTTDTCDKKKGCDYPAVSDSTPCGLAGVCLSGHCAVGSSLTPAPSCLAVLQTLGKAAKDGVFCHDPDGAKGSEPAYQVAAAATGKQQTANSSHNPK